MFTLNFVNMSMFCQNLKKKLILNYRNGRGHTGFPSEDAVKTKSLPTESPEHIHFIFASMSQTLLLSGKRTIE